MPVDYPTDLTREEWLQAAARRIEADWSAFESMPRYRVTCGFPSKGARARTRRVIGQCYDASASADGAHEVMVSPVIADPIEALHVLAHEMLHAAVGVANGHGPAFKRGMRGIMEGKATATRPTETFRAWAELVVDDIGPYPHAVLDPGSERRQTTRMLKVECRCEETPYIARLSRAQLDRGAPICPLCGSEMRPA